VENGGHLRALPTLVEFVDGAYRDASKCTDANCTHAKYLEYACKEDAENCSHVERVPLYPEGVNYYCAPGQVVNLWGTSDNPSKGGSCGEYPTTETFRDRQELLSNIIHDEDGMYIRAGVYHSASVYLANGTTELKNHAEFGKATDVLTPGNGGMGKYAVIKLRISNLNEGVKLGIISDASIADSSKEVKYNIRAPKLLSTDEFVVYVVDISNAADPAATTVCVKLGTDTQCVAGAGFDFGYFAICDNWTEIERVVGDEGVTFVTDWANDEGTVFTPAQIDQKVADEAAAQ